MSNQSIFIRTFPVTKPAFAIGSGRNSRLALCNEAAAPPDEAGTPMVTRSQRMLAGLCVGVLLLTGAAATPFAQIKLMPIPGYMAAFGSAMIVVNILLASLLFSKGAIQRRGDATRLGVAYLFVAAIFVPLVACFPGAIVPGSIIGTPVSAVWLWSAWHAGFGLLMCRYAWFANQLNPRKASAALAMVAVAAGVVAIAVVSTDLVEYLPSTFSDGHTLFSGTSGVIPLLIMLILGSALTLLLRQPVQTREQIWLVVALTAAIFDVWLTYQGSSRFSLGWYLSKFGSLCTSIVVLVSMMHEVTLLHSRAAAANEVLSGLANHDGLTGLCNRRHLDALLSLEWRRSARERKPLSLLMIDVDCFKTFNDTYGHPAGDECLRKVAAMLETVAGRPGDTAARYGGEEFVVLLPSTDAAGAVEIARRVQAAVRKLDIRHEVSSLGRVSLSIGLATAIADPTRIVADLVAEADRGVYRAKALGRNQVCWGDEGCAPREHALVDDHHLSADPVHV